MIGGKRFLGLVPARGGSKGVPRKNIRPLAGQSLLAHSIAQAKQVAGFDAVVVSTEDAEIRREALKAGAEVVDRPPALAADDLPSEDAMIDALDSLKRAGREFDYIVLLEPTSPLRQPDTIRRCMEMAVARDAKVVLTATRVTAHLGRVVEDCFKPLFPDEPRRRQDRKPVYGEAGVAYVVDCGHLRRTGRIFADTDVHVVVVDATEAADINTEDDFVHCEALLAQRAKAAGQR